MLAAMNRVTAGVLIVFLLILFGIVYVHKELKEVNACASQMNETKCMQEYYKNNSWVQRWF